MSTAVASNELKPSRVPPANLASTRKRNSRTACRLALKALRWSVAEVLGVWSSTRKIMVGDTVYFIDRTDDYISRELSREGGYHKQRLESAIELLQERRGISSGVVLNVGAHVGTALIPILQTGVFDEGLAVEPAPSNAGLLERNLEANGLLDHVQIVRVAIGDKIGQSVLHLSRTNTGNNTLCENKLVWLPFRPKVSVAVTTIDRLLEEQGVDPHDVSFVVMDIQGYEEQAISGGHSLFSLSPPLMMEMDHHYIDSPLRLSAVCRSIGTYYRWFYDLDDASLTTHPISHLEGHFSTYSDYRDMVFL